MSMPDLTLNGKRTTRPNERHPAMLNPIYIPPLPPIREKTGLVAFRDILGFRRNKADTAEIVEQMYREMETTAGV